MMVAKKLQRRTHIGPYQILAKIGEGGMGTVYLTKMDGPAGFNKLAVVKELRADLTGSKALVQMFLNEAKLAARLTHPNVVHTYGANEDEGGLYLAMEHLDGQPWSRIRQALWESGTLPFALHGKVLAEILSGLHYAHELRDYDGTPLQVVHCDMSPQNVFVTYDGQVKVVDFGVARAVTNQRQTGTKVLIGKLAYIAPEQARGEELDRRADIFAVGVMLWELMAGKRFAEGADWRAMRERRATGAEPRIREVVPNAPPKLAEICDRALALDRADRFSTAGEFREALLGYLSEDMQDVDHAQLGELVVNEFHEDRTRVHSLIERNLKGSSMMPAAVEDLVASLSSEPGDHTLKADLSELASVSRLRDDVALMSASHSASIRLERRAPRRRMLWAAMAGGTLLLAGGIWMRASPGPVAVHATPLPAAVIQPMASSQPGNGAVAEPTPTAALAAQANPSPGQVAPQLIQLMVSATPPEATLVLDGVPLRSNPYSERFRGDDELHLLRAGGPGLQTQERVIAFDRDRTISFRLARLPAQARPVARATRRGSSDSVVSASVLVPAIDPPAPQPPTAAGNEQRRAKADPGYDANLTPNTNTRAIYDEDPYR
jgi:serine/threonine protein kinase